LVSAPPALAQLEEAGRLVDEARDPRLAFAVLHGQIWCAITRGRWNDAELLLPAARALLERSATTARPAATARPTATPPPAATAPPAAAEKPPAASQPGGDVESLWLRRAEARLDLALGETGPAEQALREVVRDLLLLDRHADAALAFLDLSALDLRENAGETLRRLAPAILPAFSSPEVRRPEIYALLLVQRACESGDLTPELARQLASVLEIERRPSLDWWSGSGTVLPADRQLLFLSGELPLLISRVDYLRRPELAARADPNPLYTAAGAAPKPRGEALLRGVAVT
jgi:hypothetical protein